MATQYEWKCERLHAHGGLGDPEDHFKRYLYPSALGFGPKREFFDALRADVLKGKVKCPECGDVIREHVSPIPASSSVYTAGVVAFKEWLDDLIKSAQNSTLVQASIQSTTVRTRVSEQIETLQSLLEKVVANGGDTDAAAKALTAVVREAHHEMQTSFASKVGEVMSETDRLRKQVEQRFGGHVAALEKRQDALPQPPLSERAAYQALEAADETNDERDARLFEEIAVACENSGLTPTLRRVEACDERAQAYDFVIHKGNQYRYLNADGCRRLYEKTGQTRFISSDKSEYEHVAKIREQQRRHFMCTLFMANAVSACGVRLASGCFRIDHAGRWQKNTPLGWVVCASHETTRVGVLYEMARRMLAGSGVYADMPGVMDQSALLELVSSAVRNPLESAPDLDAARRGGTRNLEAPSYAASRRDPNVVKIDGVTYEFAQDTKSWSTGGAPVASTLNTRLLDEIRYERQARAEIRRRLLWTQEQESMATRSGSTVGVIVYDEDTDELYTRSNGHWLRLTESRRGQGAVPSLEVVDMPASKAQRLDKLMTHRLEFRGLLTGTQKEITMSNNHGGVSINGGSGGAPGAAPSEGWSMGNFFNSMGRKLVEDANDAAWRVGASQFNEQSRALIAKIVTEMMPAEQQEQYAPMVAGFFGSPAGETVAGMLIGLAIEAAPISNNRKTRLAKELRVGGMTAGGNALLRKVLAPLQSFVMRDLPAMINALPDPDATEPTGVRADASEPAADAAPAGAPADATATAPTTATRA